MAQSSRGRCESSSPAQAQVEAASGGQKAMAGSEDTVLIAGAGIAGAAVGVALHKIGVPIVIIEKATHLRTEGAGIFIQTNGWKALRQLGVSDSLAKASWPVNGLRQHSPEDFDKIVGGYDKECCKGGPHQLHGVYRGRIIEQLLATLPKDVVKFGVTVTHLTQTETGAIVKLSNGKEVKVKAIVGADGAWSQVRKQALEVEPQVTQHHPVFRGLTDPSCDLAAEIPEYGQQYFHFLRDATTAFGTYLLDHNAAYWFFITQAPELQDMQHLTNAERKAQLLKSTKGKYGDVIHRLIKLSSEKDFFYNHTADRVPEPGKPWGKGCVTLVGDAAHPTQPNLGQGGNMALEDALELGIALRRAVDAAGSWAAVDHKALEAALRGFEVGRSQRCAMLVDRARAVKIEMFGEPEPRKHVLAQAAEVVRRVVTFVPWLVAQQLRREPKASEVKFNITSSLDHTIWEPSDVLVH